MRTARSKSCGGPRGGTVAAPAPARASRRMRSRRTGRRRTGQPPGSENGMRFRRIIAIVKAVSPKSGSGNPTVSITARRRPRLLSHPRERARRSANPTLSRWTRGRSDGTNAVRDRPGAERSLQRELSRHCFGHRPVMPLRGSAGVQTSRRARCGSHRYYDGLICGLRTTRRCFGHSAHRARERGSAPAPLVGGTLSGHSSTRAARFCFAPKPKAS
jgi:hypothetical protein